MRPIIFKSPAAAVSADSEEEVKVDAVIAETDDVEPVEERERKSSADRVKNAKAQLKAWWGGLSKGQKAALVLVPVAVIIGAAVWGTVETVNHVNFMEDNKILTGDKDKLEEDNKGLQDQLDEAKKPTTVVFDENQISQISAKLVLGKGIPGKLTGLRAQHFNTETNVLTLYFDGIKSGKEVIFSTQITCKDSKFTSEDAKLALETESPMCQVYKSVEEFELNSGVYEAAKKTSLVKISSALGNSSTEIVTIDDIKMEITITRNAARKTAKVTYRALLVDGEKISLVDEGVLTVDYDTTDAEANSIVIKNFVEANGAQTSAQMIEEDEM